MSTTPQPVSESGETQPTSGGLPAWLIAIIVVIALLLGYVAYAQRAAKQELSAQLTELNGKLTQVTARAATLEDNYANLTA